MEVLAETKFLFRGDKSALVYNWEGYGLKLHVPAGSSASFKAETIYSTVFELPEGTEPVSPFYCVSSKGELTGPVGVEIQHFADGMDCSGLSFAACKVENKKIAKYVFKEYSAQFSNISSYGKMEVNFSSWIFYIKRKLNSNNAPLFLAQLYYLNNVHQPSKMQADIVIVPNVDQSEVSSKFVINMSCANF